jgi:hypothetical protein
MNIRLSLNIFASLSSDVSTEEEAFGEAGIIIYVVSWGTCREPYIGLPRVVT